MSGPIPIITCGRHEAVAAAVKESLKPEYEAIHMTLSLEAGLTELPLLLGGEKPPSESDSIGTKDYSKRAEAVVVGNGYEEPQVLEMREACKGVSNVPWLRANKDTPMPPMGPAYGAAITERVKVAMRNLAAEKKMGYDGLYFY